MTLRLQTLLLTILILTIISSCVSVARIGDFPRTSEEINFNGLSLLENQDSDWSRTMKGHSQFVVVIDSIDEGQLINAISQALVSERYKISKLDSSNNVIIGKRGMTLWEWKSITGVYYEIKNSGFKVYIKNSITQDITGGFNFNRAQKVGANICNRVSSCL